MDIEIENTDLTLLCVKKQIALVSMKKRGKESKNEERARGIDGKEGGRGGREKLVRPKIHRGEPQYLEHGIHAVLIIIFHLNCLGLLHSFLLWCL